MPSEDSKPVRKAKVEEVEAEDEKAIGSLIRDSKKKPSNLSTKSYLNVKKEEVQDDELQNGQKNYPGSRVKGFKTKKEEIHDDDDEDNKPIIKRISVKTEKTVTRVEEKKKGESDKEKKVKKIYDMPGQKRDPPEERDSLRVFYETLYKQLPHSEMAQTWMMESGLLSKEMAKKVFEKKQQKQKLNSPMKAKSLLTKKEVVTSATVKKIIQSSPLSSDKNKKTISKVTKKRKLGGGSSSDDSGDDFEKSLSKKKKQRAA